MKLSALAVLLLAVGIALGLAFRATVFEAEAKPPAPQQREDQVPLTGQGFLQDTTAFAVAAPYDRIALHPADYPSNAVFRLEAVVWGSSSTICLRLFDWATFVTLPDSEVCASNLPPSNSSPPLRIRSGPFTLPAGEADYGLMGQRPDGAGGVHSSRIIAQWTEGGKGR